MASTYFAPESSLFKRCVQCPDVTPTCPPCKTDEVCSQTIATCNSCAAATCVKTALSGATNNNNGAESSGPNIGAIVGGVVGGVVAIAIITFLIWKFWLKGRRRDDSEEWDDIDLPPEKGAQFTMQRDARMSTHTVASMASTVLTRASNIIQIAYIPGVTNRATAGSPNRLVPPVPPIPMPTTNNSSTGASSPYDDQHFFVPGDLRGSTYSGASSVDARDSYAARTSIAPSLARSSVATTIYRSNAIVSSVPAQTVTRGKAAVVSVKSSQASSPLASPGETPPVPTIDHSKHGQRPVLFKIPSQGGSVDVSRSGSVGSTATIARPVPLNITRKAKTSPPSEDGSSAKKARIERPEDQAVGLGLRPLTEVSMADSVGSSIPHARANRPQSSGNSDSDTDSDDGDFHSRSRRSLLGSSPVRDSEINDIHDTPGTLQSPFADQTSTPPSPDIPAPHRRSAAALSIVEEERRRSMRPGSERGKSPFEDENRV